MTVLDATMATSLVTRIAAGDERATAELIERCGATLRFLARRFTRTEADAEDLYQETLIVAVEKIQHGEIRQPERLAGFLRSLAKNLSIQRYRRRRYAVETALDVVPETADEREASPLGGLLDRERARMTRRLLAELTVPRDREVLFRYYIAEHDSAAICADLGLDSAHFYRVLHRARQRYRQLWDARAAADTEGASP